MLFTAAALTLATPKAQFPYSHNAGFDLGLPLSLAEYQPSSPCAISKVSGSIGLTKHCRLTWIL
jgi:hypothetical protein